MILGLRCLKRNGVSEIIFSVYYMEYPTEAKYMRVKNYNDKVLARNTTRISPFNASIFGPRSVDRVLFNIPSETGMEIDMDTLMFHFRARIRTSTNVNDTTHDLYFCNSMESIIQSLRIRKGTSFLLEDIQRYNYLDSMFMNYVSKDYNEAVGAATMGIGSPEERKKNHLFGTANATDSAYKQYCIPFRLSGISNYSGLISTSLIDSVCAFQIEIELAPTTDCILAYQIAAANMGTPLATANVYYEIDKCYLSYDTVRMAPEYHTQLQASIQRGIPLQIPYKTWRTSLYSLPALTPSIVYNINDTVKSLNAVFIAFYRTEEQGKLNVAGKDRKHFPVNLKTCQLQLGSMYYPLQPMDAEEGAPQVFLELQKAMGLSFVRSEFTGPFSFAGRTFAPGTNPTVPLNQRLEGTVSAVAATQALTEAGLQAGGINPVTDTNGWQQERQNGAYTLVPYEEAAANNAKGAVFLSDFSRVVSVNCGDGAGNAGNTFLDPVVTVGTASMAGSTRNDGLRYMRETAAGSNVEFMIGFNLRKVLDAVEGEIVGSDIQSSGSGLMSLRLEFNGNTPSGVNYNCIIASLYDAVLEIQSNQQTFRVE